MLKLRKLRKEHKEREFRYSLYNDLFSILSNKGWTNNYAARYCGEQTENGYYVRSVNFEKENFLLCHCCSDSRTIIVLSESESLVAILSREEALLLTIAKIYFPWLFNFTNYFHKRKDDWLYPREFPREIDLKQTH